MKGKRIGTSVLAAVMLAGTTATSVFAAMPDKTAVIGEKAFDLMYVNNEENFDEIKAAIATAMSNSQKIYVKSNNVWYNNDASKLEDTSVIPAVVYTNGTDEDKNYEAGDGEEVTAGFAIKEISPAGVKKIKAVFTEDVDLEKVSFEVKLKKSIKTIDKIEYVDEDENKKEVMIKLDNKIVDGDYTVTVKGLDLEDNVRTFTAEDEYVADLKILGETVPVVTTMKNDEPVYNAYVEYERLNQYGEDYTKSSSNFTAGGSYVVKDSHDNKENRIKLEMKTDLFENQIVKEYPISINIQDVDPNNTDHMMVSDQATLKLVPDAKISKVTLGDVYVANEDEDGLDKKEVIGEKDELVYIKLDVEDQYGNKLDRQYLVDHNKKDDEYKAEDIGTELGQHKNFTITATGADAKIGYSLDKDDDSIYMLLTPEKDKNFNTITGQMILVIAGSNDDRKTYTVEEASKIAEIDVTLPDYVVGDEEITIEVEAMDQNGDAITGKDLEKALKIGEGKDLETRIRIDNENVNVEYDEVKDKTIITWEVPANTESYNKPANMTIKTADNKIAYKKIDISPNAIIESVSVKKDTMSKTLAKIDTEISLADLVAHDQYDRELPGEQLMEMMENADKNGIVLVKDESADKKVEVTGDVDADDPDANYIWTLKNIEEDTVFNFTVKNDDDEAEILSSVKVDIVAAKDIKALKVDTKDTMYVGGDADDYDEYAIDFDVYGVTKNGDKVTIARDNYSVTTPSYVSFEDGKLVTDLTDVEDKYMDDEDNFNLGDDKEDKAVILVFPDFDHEVEQISTNVKFSLKAPKLETLKTKKDKTTFGFEREDSSTVFTDEDVLACIDAKDQYGVKAEVADIKPSNISIIDIKMEDEDDTKPTVDGRGTSKITMNVNKVHSFKVKAYYGGDRFVEFKVVVQDPKPEK